MVSYIDRTIVFVGSHDFDRVAVQRYDFPLKA
jgi:hypothetical protein